MRRTLKLSPRFYGPYQVLQKIGKVAYKLDLPPGARIYPVFHVSNLKKKLGQHVTPQITLPYINEDGIAQAQPEAILDRQLVKRLGRADAEVLVQWQRARAEDTTWELYSKLQERFPEFDLEDAVAQRGGQ